MIDQEQAEKIAAQHLTENPLPSGDYKWKLTKPKEGSYGWVFEYSYECLTGLPPDEWELFGGAPGFIVLNESGAVRDIDWAEMGETTS